MDQIGKSLSVEFFAAKTLGIFMTVPRECGLDQADTLRIDGLAMVALRKHSVLPIDLPPLTEPSRQRLVTAVGSKGRLAVSEFVNRGIAKAYFLDVEVIN